MMNFNYVLYLLASFACIIAGAPSQEKKKTEEMQSLMQSQVDAQLSAYSSAQEQIQTAENKWNNEQIEKQKAQKRTINEALVEISKEMKYTKKILPDQRDQVLAEASTNVQRAEQQLDNANAAEEETRRALNEADAAQIAITKQIDELREQLKASGNVYSKAKSAHSQAQQRQKRAQEELVREKERNNKVNEQMNVTQKAQSTMAQYEHEHANKKGFREAVEPFVNAAVEKREALTQAIRKELMLCELEVLVSNVNLSIYSASNQVNAKHIHPFAKNRDKILYFANKYFGVCHSPSSSQKNANTARDPSCQCPEVAPAVGEATTKKGGSGAITRRTSLKRLTLALASSAKSTQHNEFVTNIVSMACRTYEEMVSRLEHDETEKLSELLMKDLKNGTVDTANQELEGQVDTKLRKLITARQIKEYPIDQQWASSSVAVDQLQQQQQQQHPADGEEKAVVFEQGESSGTKGADQQTMMEDENGISQPEIVEIEETARQQSPVSDGTAQHQQQQQQAAASSSSSSSSNGGTEGDGQVGSSNAAVKKQTKTSSKSGGGGKMRKRPTLGQILNVQSAAGADDGQNGTTKKGAAAVVDKQ